MKYLIHKKEELYKSKFAAKKTTKCQDILAKTNVSFPQLSSVFKPKGRRAHIVFLKNMTETSNAHKGPETLINYKSCSEAGNELESHKAINSVNAINQSKSKTALSSENDLEFFHEKPIHSAKNVTDRYVPNGELEHLSDYDISLWREDCSVTRGRKDAERKEFKSDSYNSSDCIDRKENIIPELDRNSTNLEQYIQEFSKDLSKAHKSNFDDSVFQLDKFERSFTDISKSHPKKSFANNCKNRSFDEIHSFHNIEKSHSSNEFLQLKSYHSNFGSQESKYQVTKQKSFSQNSDNVSFGEFGTAPFSNNPEVPHSFNSSVSKNDKQYFDGVKANKPQNSKYQPPLLISDDLSSDFFSSGESIMLTPLNNLEKTSASKLKNESSHNCDVKVDERKFSKHPSFSQSSDNFSSDITSSAESGILISSNEYIMNEDESIGFADHLHRYINNSTNVSLRPESVVDEDSFDYSLPECQRNCDIISSPDIFCDIKQDVPHYIPDFSVNNIRSKPCNKSSPLFLPNSEMYSDSNMHEPTYNAPFIYDNAYGNIVADRFINYFNVNNYSQNLPLHALPHFAQIRNYPTLNMGNVARCSNIVPNNENCVMDSYYPENAPNFNNSMFINEDIPSFLGVPIKQEPLEPFLPAGELSHSLNNFVNAGYCYSQRNFDSH